MSAPPTIPPRPSRSQNSPAPAPASSLDTPKVPPRPKRGIERSVSPNGDRFARSPLNDPTYLHTGPPKEGSRLSTELPPRPPSVSLPSLGEEGNEYASFEDLSKTLTNDSLHLGGSPQQTKNVAGDLPLHAPTASVPSSTAKSRIQVVTRTDSSQAEAAGFGKQLAPDDRTAPSSKSGRSGSSAGSRPSSIYNDKEEQGIPEIGVQVPMFRNAGDVQAPSPAPFAQQTAPSGPASGSSQRPRHHGRTKSGREIFHGPPGSYGMHGHGVIPKDEFTQKWYEKHPEDLKREKAGEYGPHIQENRKDYHWRADNLEKLVHMKSQDIGMGTSRDAVGTPDEHIGFLASEQYSSRMASPRPSSGRPASIKASQIESPLRNEAGEEVNEAGEVIHIDPPAHRSSKIHGANYDAPTQDLGPEGGNTEEKGGWVTERGYGTPILASDELKKRAGGEWREPAVSPELERHGNEYVANEDNSPGYLSKARSHSRSSSRNSNQAQRVISGPTHFDRSGQALESHKEYEPLFPEDEDHSTKPKSAVDKLKRPTIARHHFPSQDVWEDAPGSLQLETTVETPQAPEEPETPAAEGSAAKAFEDPEAEEQRKTHITKEDQQSFLPEQTKRFAAENKLLGKVRDELPLRPGMQQRFPSQDIWEDAPSHGHLETTVSTPQVDDANEYAEDSPVVEKPTIPARPDVPTRPVKKELSPVDKKAPIIPDRPKPQIPARPTKASTGSSEKVPTLEPQSSEREAVEHKPKPPVPARPAGSKIAALQAGFLKDLNSKLGLGPQAPKVKEPEPEQQEEAAPLTDARKGRAKGPQRRKPAASPTPVATITAEVAVPKVKLEIAPVTELWSFGADGTLDVPSARLSAKISESLRAPSKKEEPEVVQPVEDKDTVTEPEESELTKTATKDSEAPSSALEPTISKTSTVLEPEEPLVTETTSGSVDAPGAFPGSGPELEDEVDEDVKGGVALEEPTKVEQPVVQPQVESQLQKEAELPTAAEPLAAPVAAPASTTAATGLDKE